jgi:cyclic-di-GMP-binding protein
MPSFDAVSELDGHEVTNGVDQANRELAQRFDFKGTVAEFTRDLKEPFVVIMKAEAEFQLKQMLEILKLRLAKRGVDVGCIEVKDAEVNLAEARQKVVLKHGIDQDTAKKIVKQLKESGLKVQAQIQGDKVRVTGKQRDDLQNAIALLRKSSVGVPLQFENFRD